MIPQTLKRRLNIHDIARASSPNVYVKNRASDRNKVATILLIDHKFSNGNVEVIHVPPTWIPQDLSLRIPKEELIGNPNFMRLVSQGNLELLETSAAEKELNTPEAIAEAERLNQANIVVRSNNVQGVETRVQIPGEVPAPGDIDVGLIGVNPSLVDALVNPEYSDINRISMIRNLVNILEEADLAYIAKHTDNPDILKLIQKTI